MPFRVVPTSDYHVAAISVRPEFKLEGGWQARARTAVAAMSALTVLDEKGMPVAIFGANHINSNTAHIWALVSLAVRKRPIEFHKLALRLTSSYIRTHSLGRLQITIRNDFKEAERWAIGLGYRFEGILRGYGTDGSDYLMYARVK
jgi:hypothetical protein